MDPLSAISEELAEIDGQIADIFRALSNGFQKLEKIQDSNRQSRQLEELTDKMRDCKGRTQCTRLPLYAGSGRCETVRVIEWLIKEFDREVKNMERINDPNTSRMLNEKKQSMIEPLCRSKS
ncbi:novel plant SNARE 11-like [Malus domestica]|uniref:novel plant SNARE 11-like n=1 Tax=Malus domestica TaxID=3750 RepID=UPI003976745A